METAELDEICIALEPRPGNDSWDLDPEYNKITQDHRGIVTEFDDSRIDGVSSQRYLRIQAQIPAKLPGQHANSNDDKS
ncbi:MAG TPA: hypothetical protein VJ577_01320 [Burkholderiaceae bacterium]|nr:hypothetical protein [Burkholderiaceae bacterium]